LKQRKEQHEIVKKMVLIGLFTALTVVFGFIKIPIMGVTIKMDLPVVILGAVILGPIVGAWLTVIPTLITFFTGEAALFMTYSPLGTALTLFLKGVLAGLAAGLVYKALSGKHPIGAVTCAAATATVVNSGVFLLGCYVFIWEHLVVLAAQSNVSIFVLILGLVLINFVIELVMNVILCPTIFRILQSAMKNKRA
jgi:uncharacterized membrane protein